ncbi:MAG: PrgI family protein [Candidatus Saccharibacteria bacterium]
MATYKVPQDVEADDKLIGPFSFRQFIYLIVVALSGALSWGLAQLFIGLAVIPLPVIIFFGALALPLRKDQPMEIYMAAIASFYIKPRMRKWDPDGIESLVEVSAPKVVEKKRTKDISQSEAQERFGYLANLVDSQGWAIRGVNMIPPNSTMNDDFYLESVNAPDMLDSTSFDSKKLSDNLDQQDTQRKQDIMAQMRQQIDEAALHPKPTPEPPTKTPPIVTPYEPGITTPIITQQFSPPEPMINTSEKPPSAGIIELANNNDLSIATIATQANRINNIQDNNEVFISLR